MAQIAAADEIMNDMDLEERNLCRTQLQTQTSTYSTDYAIVAPSSINFASNYITETVM